MSWIHSVLFLFLVFRWCITGESSSPEVTDDGAPMEKREQEALYSVIQGFVGDSWNGSDLYPDPCGWTPIQGVSCDLYDELWYVTDLTLGLVHENSLPCTASLKIRPQLFEFKHLKSLSFFNCFSSPITIHKEWINLGSSLESLEFRSNPGLNGELPETIGSLTKLKSLVVLENGLNGKLPTSLCNLTSLKRLVLAGNSFTGTIPDCFDGFKDLLIMDLSRNALSGTLPLSIGGMVSLLKLDLSNNQIEGKLPQVIGFLKNLTLLDLRNNRISGELSGNVEKIRSLTDLVLSGNPMGGDDDMMGIKWENMGILVNLDLSKMGLRGEIPSGLTKLKRLRFLGLNDNELTGTVPSKEFETMPCLGALYINGNNLTGELRFSRKFYEKMGTRFKASKNPNLCQYYPIDIVSESQRYVPPLGLKPCMVMEKTKGNLVIQQTWSNRKKDESSSSIAVIVTRHVLWDLLLEFSLIVVFFF